MITSFLTDLKTVFNNYSATLAIVDLSGYGISYGNGNGLSFALNKDGINAEKVFGATSITQGDM